MAVAALACGVLLTGCSEGAAPGPDRPAATAAAAGPGPTATATATAAPPRAAALAERYRAAGGDPDVYAIEHAPGPDGVPRLVVRSRSADPGDARFRAQNASVTGFLTAKEGVSLSRGYRIDVYGPDGALLHRMDAARP
ncbi:hypothetical protein ABZ766_18395 [Streptomyces sp. NPDC006670]|uniref:hypothetical protein n=1 Tax=Streptomyces sp. NPDC006670 TaxID=3154476 RepID=UPI0033C3AA62